MSRVVIVRHGNTFEAGEASRMVGKHEDVPLVARGEEQSRAVGRALRGVAVAEVVTSPAVRCRRMSQLIVEEGGLGVEPRVEPRLGELDYGTWGGLTDEELLARFGAEMVDGWRKRGLWPMAGEWGDGPGELLAEVSAMLDELARDDHAVRVVVTHGGRARFFHEALVGDRTRALKTGQAAVIEWAPGHGHWHVLGWDMDAEALTATLQRYGAE